MLWIAYNILFAVAFAAMLPHYLWRMKKRGGYKGDFWNRMGIFRPEIKDQLREKRRIWIHAVSVGEVFVGLQIIRELRTRNPEWGFVLSVTTSTGHAIAQKELGDDDVLIYFPVDFPPVIKRVVGLINPLALVLVEGEYWPNLLRKLNKRGVPISLVNGRLSDSSYRGYSRLRIFTGRIFPLINPICMQSAVDAGRMIALGAPRSHVHAMGSAKYEVAHRDPEAEERVGQILERIGFSDRALVLLGGSTWPGEEEALINCYTELRAQFPSLVLVLAPRHVERTPEVIQLLNDAGLDHLLRSECDQHDGEKPEVLLVNTTGELRHFYAHADVIFIGKSLTEKGGQNPIEAALHGKAVIVGPNMQNFPVIVRDFVEADAIAQVVDQRSLSTRTKAFLYDVHMRRAFGERASALVERKRGAVTASVNLIEEQIKRSG